MKVMPFSNVNYVSKSIAFSASISEQKGIDIAKEIIAISNLASKGNINASKNLEFIKNSKIPSIMSNLTPNQIEEFKKGFNSVKIAK